MGRNHLYQLLLWTVAAMTVLLGLSGSVFGAGKAASEEDGRFFRDLAETRNYTLGTPLYANPTPDGKAVLFLRSGPRDPVMRLYELTVKGGRVEEVLSPEDVLKGGEERLSVEEKARRERMRMTLRGFTSFALSNDGSRILVSLSGGLYVIRRADKSVISLPAREESWMDPRFSPDGRFVSATMSNDLYVIDLDSLAVTQVTSGATDTLQHAVAEFVAQEEMGRYTGYWWSPDSERIVYQESDLSEVETLYIMSPSHPEAPPIGYHYPRAGTRNAKVRLGAISRTGGETTWIGWDTEEYPYLARVVWQPSAPLTLLVQMRDQKKEQLLVADPDTGTTRALLTETDDAWLNLDDNRSQAPMPYWINKGEAFIWNTERRGGWQLELRDREGALVRELTPVELGLSELVDVDDKSGSMIVAGGPDPREHHLYRVPLKGGKPERISQGQGVHQAVFSKNHKVNVYGYVLAGGERGFLVRSTDGKRKAELPSVAEQPPFFPNIEFLRIGEARQFDAVIIRPRQPLEPGKKYPVLLDVYGGPGYKAVVRNPFPYLLDQWMADQGYIVVSLDGRGTPGHGREWERAIAGDLIDVVLEDQVEGLRALGQKFPEMDLERVGVHGWSFGGYFTAMATIRRPDVFKAGVAGAPVTDWADYDTHYTERYLNLPSINPEGYRKSSVLIYADQLERPLMLIHGLTDDNVYFVHTLKLADALFQAGHPYELITLPGTHLLPDPTQRLRLWNRMMAFFDAQLQSPRCGGCPMPVPPASNGTAQ